MFLTVDSIQFDWGNRCIGKFRHLSRRHFSIELVIDKKTSISGRQWFEVGLKLLQ